MSPAGRVQEWFHVGGNPGGRDVVFPIPTVDLLESDRRSAEGERRRIEKCYNVKWRMTLLRVVKTVTDTIFASSGRCDDRLTARLCTFRAVDRGKNWSPFTDGSS